METAQNNSNDANPNQTPGSDTTSTGQKITYTDADVTDSNSSGNLGGGRIGGDGVPPTRNELPSDDEAFVSDDVSGT